MERDNKQLEQLAEPFPDKLIKQPPRGKFGVYVAHSTVTERLLSIVGPFGYEIVQVIHGYAPAVVGNKGTKDNPQWPAREHAVVGCVGRLTVEVDGRKVIVEEAGDVEAPAMELDGRNLKDASSDAIKRCAMRLGLGLHLWSQDDYFLNRQLEKDAAEDTVEVEGPTPEAEAVRERYRQDEERPEPEGPPPDFPPGEGYEPPVDEPPTPAEPLDEAAATVEAAIPAVMSTDRAKSYLEWEVALDTAGRMKCKEECERSDVTKSDAFCCQDAHLRRLYQTAEVGLGLPHKRGYKDLLHQALAKIDANHVADLRKPKLEELINNSKATFTEMLYGPVQV